MDAKVIASRNKISRSDKTMIEPRYSRIHYAIRNEAIAMFAAIEMEAERKFRQASGKYYPDSNIKRDYWLYTKELQPYARKKNVEVWIEENLLKSGKKERTVSFIDNDGESEDEIKVRYKAVARLARELERIYGS